MGVTVEAYVDADVSISDFLAELASRENPKRVQECTQVVSVTYSVLRSIPDALIAEISPANRKTIYDALQKETNRFAAVEVQNNG